MSGEFRFYQRQVTTVVEFVSIDGLEVSLGDVQEILEDLKVGGFDALVIYNKNLREVLKKRRVINLTARGSFVRGPGFEDFYKQFQEEGKAYDERTDHN